MGRGGALRQEALVSLSEADRRSSCRDAAFGPLERTGASGCSDLSTRPGMESDPKRHARTGFDLQPFAGLDVLLKDKK